ncbi:hypothetical protein V1509DRAFT_28927 [Lipomyces kononenkoae]
MLPYCHALTGLPGNPLDINDIHPRWRVHPAFPPLNIPWQHVDPGRLAVLKDPSVELPRYGRPRGKKKRTTTKGIKVTPDYILRDNSSLGEWGDWKREIERVFECKPHNRRLQTSAEKVKHDADKWRT